MSQTSIIDIQLNDGAWKTFSRQVEDHRKILKAMPGQWGAVGGAINKTTGAAAKFVARIAATKDQFAKANGFAGKMTLALKASDRVASSLARNTLTVARNLKDATKSLLSWMSITGIISGLMGAGGLFGIARLAQGVASSQSQARGTGSTIGETKAAEIAYGNMVNVAGVLAKINEARQSGGMANGKPVFAMAGMSDKEWQGKSSAEILPAYLNAIKQKFQELAVSTGGKPGLASKATGLEEVVSFEELTRLSTSNLSLASSIYQSNKRQLDLSESTQSAWVRFNTQLNIAGESLSNVFIRALTPLTPALSDFSNSLVKAVQTIMNHPLISNMIKGAGEMIQKGADYLASGEFSKDFKSFMAEMKKIGSAVVSVAETLNRWFGTEEEKPALTVEEKVFNDAYIAGDVGKMSKLNAARGPVGGMLGAQNGNVNVSVAVRNETGSSVVAQSLAATSSIIPRISIQGQ